MNNLNFFLLFQKLIHRKAIHFFILLVISFISSSSSLPFKVVGGNSVKTTKKVTKKTIAFNVISSIDHENDRINKDYIVKNQTQTYFIDQSVSDLEVHLKTKTLENDSFHFFTHGKPGELLIDGKWLGKEEIAAFVNSKISNSQSQISYLNIYGCNFAEGEKGLQALAYLENTLSLQVSASTNITGNGGDWVLEEGPKNKGLELADYKGNLQTISPSNGTVRCSNCVPAGWTDGGGTPDISNANNAGGGSNLYGLNATWVNTLPLPPNNHTEWISLRDLGSAITQESVFTAMSGLTPGVTYELVFYTLTSKTNQNGGSFFGSGNGWYAGTYIDALSYQIDGGAIQSLAVNEETWATTRISFLATAATAIIRLIPINNGAYVAGTESQPNARSYLIETAQVSITANAINALPIADNNTAVTTTEIPVTFNVTSTDTDPDGTINIASVDLDPSLPGIQSSFTTADGTFTVNSSGDVTFTSIPGFTSDVSIPYTVQDNYVLDGVPNPCTSNQATLTVTVLDTTCTDGATVGTATANDPDGDGINNICDLDDDNDGILDTNEGGCITVSAIENPSSSSSGLIRPQIGAGSVSYGQFGVEAKDYGGTIGYWASNGGDIPFGSSFNRIGGYDIIGSDTNSSDIERSLELVFTPNSNSVISSVAFSSGDLDRSESISIEVFVDDGNGGENLLTDISSYIVYKPTQVIVTSGVGTGLGLTGSDPSLIITAALIGNTVTFDFRAHIDFNVTENVTRIIVNGISNQTGESEFYITQVTSCLDTDGDGIPDYLDLDSDGDGCSDALESGATTNQSSLYQFPNTLVGADGVPDAVQTVAGINSGLVDYTVNSNYTNAAVTSCTNPCVAAVGIDTDNDGIDNACDLDDDNDGILDTVENNCTAAYLESFGTGSGSPATSHPSVLNTENVRVGTSADFSGEAWYRSNTGLDATGNAAGRYLALDNPQGASPVLSYQQNITVIANNPHSYSLFIAAAAEESGQPASAYPDVRIQIKDGSGTVLGIINTGTITLSWVPYEILFTSTTTTVTIEIYNNNASASYNSLLVDEIRVTTTFCDTDGDGIPNSLDLDSDGDGCPDAIEAAVPSVLQTANIVNGTVGATTSTSTANAQINTTLDIVGANGVANSLETVIDNGIIANAFTTTNYTTYALDNTKNGCGTPMITQVYWKGSEKIVEVTNNATDKVVVPNAANLNFFDAGVTTARTATAVNTTEITAGNSILFSSGAVTAQVKSGVTPITNAGITAFDNTDDVITISRSGKAGTSNLPWDSRVDVVSGLTDFTSFVRIDETLVPNTTYTAAEWVQFVDDRAVNLPFDSLDLTDGLNPYSNPPERHPHDPLQSEITAVVNTESNTLLGLHRFGATTTTGLGANTLATWPNGYPDRSRHVIVNGNYSHTNKLSARKLVVNNGSKLAVTDNLLVVTNDITLTTADDELRLVGTSQLVQTHTGGEQVSGLGKLLVDQDPSTTSTYRYNYLSSPVNTIGATTFTLASVLKDGTNALHATTPIGNLENDVAKDINFINNSYDGDATNSPLEPITLADHWIYTYAPGGNGRANWLHRYSGGTISQTDGFTMKGPGGGAQNYTFMGTPKDGDLSGKTAAADDSYLVGNPFASAISIKKFIEDNINSISGTLYFWQHVGEDESAAETSQGHNFSGYIGGYATRGIDVGAAANATTFAGPFDFDLLAEAATLSVGADIMNNVVVLNSDMESVEFESIIRGVDVLTVNYRSITSKEIVVNIDGVDVETVLFPSSPSYSNIDITMCVPAGSDVLFRSTNNTSIEFNYLKLADDDGDISCVTYGPNTAGGSGYKSPQSYIAIGQGFFIQGDATDGGVVVFNNSQREFIGEGESTSIFLRGSKPPSTIERKIGYVPTVIKLGMDFLNEETVGLHRQIAVSFNSSNSFAFDKGYDSEIYDLGHTDVYWKLPNDELKYVIAGVQEISDELEIPFEIVMDYDGSVVMQIDEITAIDREIFIKDNFTNKTYLLNNTTVGLQLEKGIYIDRFSLAFKGTVLSVNDELDEVLSSKITVYMDATNKELVIHNPESLEISKVKLFNILGQKIKQWKNIDNTLENRLKAKKLSNQIYIVNIQTNKGKISKKIILKNN